ncbi:MAG: YitT family protein [Acholeplasmataceae bacterium]|nr:YitT family protein [Acholeplasmataceae bacterium]
MEVVKTRKEHLTETFQIVLGIIIMNCGFYFFFLPQNLIIGGVTGITVLLEKITFLSKLPFFYTITITFLNGIFLVIGFIFLGKDFFIKTIFGSLLVPFVFFILELTKVDPFIIINELSEPLQLLLTAVLGSVIIGFGLGLVFRNSGSTGGIDIVQIIINRKYHQSFIFGFLMTDGIIVLLGLFIYRNVELFLFSIGAVILSALIVEWLAIKGRNSHALFIITEKADELKKAIFEVIDRGATIIDAKGGYSDLDKKLVICVIYTRQLNLARHVIDQIDKEAFTFVTHTREVVGYGFTRN